MKKIQKNRKCPLHKHCWGYKDADCHECEFSEIILKLYRKIDRLKKKLEKVEKATADMVEVVRCKDCKIRNAYGCPAFCGGNNVDDNDYCSFAERVEK